MNKWEEGILEYRLPISEWADRDSTYLIISAVDQFTEMNCIDYGVDYDPNATHCLFEYFERPFDEFVLMSLHSDLNDAVRAGNKFFNELGVKEKEQDDH